MKKGVYMMGLPFSEKVKIEVRDEGIEIRITGYLTNMECQMLIGRIQNAMFDWLVGFSGLKNEKTNAT